MVVAALLFAAVSSTGAPVPVTGSASPAAVYRIDAYLDTAPKGMDAVETVQVGIGDQRRVLQIVSYLRLGSGDPWALLRDVGAFHPDFLLGGRPADVDALLNAELGAHVSGTFQYVRGSHSLIINPFDLKIEGEHGVP